MDEQAINMAEDENILLLSDEDGNDVPFAILDEMELGGRRYIVLAPLDEEDDDADEGGVMIFRVEAAADGTERFESIEDERELQRVFDVFRIDAEDYDFCDAE